MFLCFRRLQRDYPIEIYLFYAWALSGAVLAIVFLPTADFVFTWETGVLFLLAGIASWIGNYAYNQSFKSQANLGYVEALSSTRIAITFVASVLYFGGNSSLSHIAALFGVVVGVVLVTEPQPSRKWRSVRQNWIWLALLSGTMFATLAIVNKWLFSEGIPPPVATTAFFFVAAFLYGSTAIARSKSFRLKRNVGIIVLAGAFAATANLALFSSYDLAPNLAYPVAISNSRMVLLYIISLVLGSDRFELARGVGILVTFVSVLVLSYGG